MSRYTAVVFAFVALMLSVLSLIVSLVCRAR